MQPEHYLNDVVSQFRKLKDLAEKAMVQVAAEQFFSLLDDESNSLAIVVKHMAGNMRSRWTDFLTSDGEKPDRHRDMEFLIASVDTRAAIMQAWEQGWGCLFTALEALKPPDLGNTIYIRTEPHTVMEAIHRQLTHYAYHVGQMVFLAKHLAGTKWQPLSIPRGKSEEFNAAMRRE